MHYEPDMNQSMGFFGNEGVELFFWNNSVVIEVSSFNHFLKTIIVSQLSQIFGDFSQILQSNESSLLRVKSDENFVDFISGFVVSGAGGHHVEKFSEFDLSTAVFIKLGDHLIDSLSFGFNTERIDGNFEFWMYGEVPLGSMAPPKSRSKRSKAFLISKTSSRVM